MFNALLNSTFRAVYMYVCMYVCMSNCVTCNNLQSNNSHYIPSPFKYFSKYRIMCVLIRPDGVDHHAYTIAINLVKLSNTYTASLY